jgi:Mn2+/Fe2+ NRAMP family transporter
MANEKVTVGYLTLMTIFAIAPFVNMAILAVVAFEYYESDIWNFFEKELF